MTGNYNEWTGLGRITADPKSREGGPTSATLAVNRRFKTKAGEERDEAFFIKLVFWGELANVAARLISMGDTVFVTGQLKNEEWTNKEGVKQSMIACHVNVMQLVHRNESTSLSGKSNEEGPF